MTTQATTAALDILQGFGRRNEVAFQPLAAFTDLPRIASPALERCAISIVQTLDGETLLAHCRRQCGFLGPVP